MIRIQSGLNVKDAPILGSCCSPLLNPASLLVTATNEEIVAPGRHGMIASVIDLCVGDSTIWQIDELRDGWWPGGFEIQVSP